MFREGNQAHNDGLFKKAIELYSDALKHWKHPAIYYNMALSLTNTGQVVDVEAALQESIKYGPAPLEKGKFEIVRIDGMAIGRATYEPGWRWSLHVGPAAGAASCSVEHVGIVVSGRATAAMDNGAIIEMGPGDVFHIGPGHDSWVVGDEPYISLHFLGAEHYADRR